jgi:hypothetical protein
MAAQEQGLAQLQEQFALYQHIQSYHWLADTWQWEEMSRLLTDDTEFEFDYVPSEGDQSGACSPFIPRCLPWGCVKRAS